MNTHTSYNQKSTRYVSLGFKGMYIPLQPIPLDGYIRIRLTPEPIAMINISTKNDDN